MCVHVVMCVCMCVHVVMCVCMYVCVINVYVCVCVYVHVCYVGGEGTCILLVWDGIWLLVGTK